MYPKWAGYFDEEHTYVIGEVVVMGSGVFMAKNLVLPGRFSGVDWALLGTQENGKIDHYYFPEGIQFPMPGGDKMSDKAYVCADCWKNGNFAAAFMPDEHAYLITELP